MTYPCPEHEVAIARRRTLLVVGLFLFGVCVVAAPFAGRAQRRGRGIRDIGSREGLVHVDSRARGLAERVLDLGGILHVNSGGRILFVNLRGATLNSSDIVQLAGQPQLETLVLSNTNATLQMLKPLCGHPELKELSVHGVPLFPQEITQLRECLPGCDVRDVR